MKSAYGLKIPDPDLTLTAVGPGTPCGELMRRYWQPICLSDELQDLPKRVRILGEDLVVFRDLNGRIGLHFFRCSHRGCSLEYARIEERGIRCCYHGWLYDVEGNLVDAPFEPSNSPVFQRIKQPCYPVFEYRGVVFAYMGPPEKQPLFPEYDLLLKETGTYTARIIKGVGAPVDTNWLQVHENLMDMMHLYWLHSAHSGPQFPPEYAHWPNSVDYEATAMGMRAIVNTTLPDGREWELIWELIMPTGFILYVGPAGDVKARDIAWRMPIDDTNQKMAQIRWQPDDEGERLNREREQLSAFGRKDNSYEHTQRYPDDKEAIESLGPIAIHGIENMASSDRGVVMFRKMLETAIQDVAAGRDPKGIIRDPEMVKGVPTTAGSRIVGQSQRAAAG